MTVPANWSLVSQENIRILIKSNSEFSVLKHNSFKITSKEKHHYTEAMERSHIDGGDDSTQGLPISACCSISLHSPLAYTNQ
jgi:hypothetical protein